VFLSVLQTSRRHGNGRHDNDETSDLEALHAELEPDTSTEQTLLCGRLYIGLTAHCYEPSTASLNVTLTVRIIRAESLPPREFSGTCDPYVKVCHHKYPNQDLKNGSVTMTNESSTTICT